LQRKLLCCFRSKPGREIEENRNGMTRDDLLMGFVNSPFNVEYVYLILLGIQNFMNNRQHQYDRKSISVSSYLNQN
jgi:hypothetical protein